MQHFGAVMAEQGSLQQGSKAAQRLTFQDKTLGLNATGPAISCTRHSGAQKAGLERVMFTVSLASDPLASVAVFGREVLPVFH